MSQDFYAFDVESYYDRDHSVKKLGPWGYANHDATDMYMLSVYGPDIDFCGHPDDFDLSQLNGKHLLAHNAGFDLPMVQGYTQKKNLDDFIPASVSCTADLAAFSGLPRDLAGAASVAFGEEVPKLMRNWMSGKSWAHAEAKGKAPELIDYCRRDSIYCHRLWQGFEHAWPAFERKLSAHTRLLKYRGVKVDKDLLAKGIEQLKRVKENAAKLIPWAGDETKNTLSLAVMREVCRPLGINPPKSMAKDSPEYQIWADKHKEQFPFIHAISDYRRSNMLLRILEAIEIRLRVDGTIPIDLKYHGAHTGRWSGDAGVNMQNLPRGEMYGVNLRHLFVPRDGHKFVIVDLSQIEPRVLYWLSGDEPMLERLRQDEPLYQAHAKATMNWKGDGRLKDVDPRLYRLAKARVLGLGYGCGPAKFMSVAKTMADIELAEPIAKQVVSAWRSSNPKITNYWRQLEALAHDAKGQRNDFTLALPSGRNMNWFNPRPDPEDTNALLMDTIRAGRSLYFWGGKITENVVQGVSRDVFAENILSVEDAGIKILWHCHDELICEVRTEDADDALAAITKIMSTPPAWAEGLPLACVGAVHDRYDK